MDKEYYKKVSNYRYRVLNYNDWIKYVKQEYEKTALKNIDAKSKKQRAQVKNSPLNFCC
jgi:hypothetical protein|tara:strand:+ start:729 stop:905 length:177 start_codon:yes stop_codon:yes gene_type:complete